jgi:hypothetical protein
LSASNATKWQTGPARLHSSVRSKSKNPQVAAYQLNMPLPTDTVETYWDSHVDLLQRRLQKHSDRLKMRAEETFKIRDLSGDLLAENFEREFKSFRLRVSSRMTKLSSSWQSAKVVRTREKLRCGQPRPVLFAIIDASATQFLLWCDDFGLFRPPLWSGTTVRRHFYLSPNTMLICLRWAHISYTLQGAPRVFSPFQIVS